MLLSGLIVLTTTLSGAQAIPVSSNSFEPDVPFLAGPVMTPEKMQITLGKTADLCLDVPWGNFTPGTPLQVAKCNSVGSVPVEAQTWTAELIRGPAKPEAGKPPGGYRRMRTGSQGQYCLAIGKDDELIIDLCSEKPNQRWAWLISIPDQEAYMKQQGDGDNIVEVSGHPLMSLDPGRANQCVEAVKTTDGGRVKLGKCDDKDNQSWSMAAVRTAE